MNAIILKDTGKGFSEILTPDAQTTTDSYADVAGSLIDTAERAVGTVAFTMKNTHGSNGITWKPVASIDGTDWVDADTEANVAAGAVDGFTASPAAYRYYKAQVKAQVGGSQGTARVRVIAK